MLTIDNWRSTLMRAAINCHHSITDDGVTVLKDFHDRDRNALAQLADRLAEAVKPLLDERDRLEKALALVKQHHATAWNRGHTIGMAAQEETARKALEAVKQDAWGNAQLTEALMAAEAERDRLAAEVEALRVALRFYATGEHFHIDPDEDWDSVSGEPENWLCSDRENSTTMLENGTVARMVLQGKPIDWSADGEDCTPSIVPNEAPAAAMKGKP